MCVSVLDMAWYLNVGMPDSAETPAPVSTHTCFAAARRAWKDDTADANLDSNEIDREVTGLRHVPCYETPTYCPEAKLRQVGEIKTCTGTTIGSSVV